MIATPASPSRDVSDVTGFPEMLDGRVKTMHPKITGGILAMRAKPEHMAALAAHGIAPIDMVVVNLYAFEEVAAKADAHLEELIENIDIGGPTMIRSAAKNYQDVAVVASPADYPAILEELRAAGGELSRAEPSGGSRRRPSAPPPITIAPSAPASRRSTTRRARSRPISRHPRAQAAWTCATARIRTSRPRSTAAPAQGIAGAAQLHGKELSYNNLVDLDAAWQLVNEFDSPAAAIIKHTNPCGCAEQATLAEAYRKAFECDPVSAFGGVIGFNRAVDEETAREVAKTFVEAIAAPGLHAPKRSPSSPPRRICA